MDYSIQLNAVNNAEKKVRAFATVVFGGVFKISNIAVLEGKGNQPFVSMPSFASKERTENNETVYKDICNPITKEFREELYGAILDLYAELERTGKAEVKMEVESPQEPEFEVKVTPYEKEGSNILGLGRIYFEDSFVVGNVSILKGKEKEFVAMPSHRVKGRGDKPVYQDICYPITKEFREKLNDRLLECYQQKKEQALSESRQQAVAQSSMVAENRQWEQELPFR